MGFSQLSLPKRTIYNDITNMIITTFDLIGEQYE